MIESLHDPFRQQHEIESLTIGNIVI